MILHPAVLALLVGSAASLFLIFLGCAVGMKVLTRWDYGSSSADQLALERQTYLASTVVRWAVGLGVASTLLFVYTADEIHALLVGAMCATGSLNANPVGWWALLAKGLVLFCGAGWLALDGMDRRAETMPLVRTKYGLLFLVAPVFAADAYLQARYFLGIDPDVITSCCGTLFTSGDTSPASTLASFPPAPTLLVFYLGAGLYLFLGALCWRFRSAWAAVGMGVMAATMMPISLVAIISVFALYIYSSPVHHCPFDVFQSGYAFLGYPMYGTLVLSTLYGLGQLLIVPLRRRPVLVKEAWNLRRRWARRGLFAMAAFVVIVTLPMVLGSLRLPGL